MEDFTFTFNEEFLFLHAGTHMYISMKINKLIYINSEIKFESEC